MSESNFRITNKRRHTYQRGESFVIVDGLASCDGLVQSSFHVEVRHGKHTAQVAEVTAFYAWDAVNKIREKIAQTICKLQKL